MPIKRICEDCKFFDTGFILRSGKCQIDGSRRSYDDTCNNFVSFLESDQDIYLEYK